jgi:hypothetical protein
MEFYGAMINQLFSTTYNPLTMAELSKLDSRQNGLPHAVSQQRKVLRTPVMLALTVVGAIIT